MTEEIDKNQVIKNILKPGRIMKCLSGDIGTSETERLINKANRLAKKRLFFQCVMPSKRPEQSLRTIDNQIQDIIDKIDKIDNKLKIEMSKPLFDVEE